MESYQSSNAILGMRKTNLHERHKIVADEFNRFFSHTLQKVQRNKNNPSSLWKVINLATPFWECERQIYTKDHKIVADEFNRFFSTVGRNPAKAAAKLVTASHINCSGLPSLSPLASQVMIFLILNLCPVKT